jgi:hypothetical protein
MTSDFGNTLRRMLKVFQIFATVLFPSSGLINPAMFAEMLGNL